ncbi:MAG: hypothetical protein LBT78_07795, partial [Tannerella sp.]|nr:hypothetical protein [Tannerella sp.]
KKVLPGEQAYLYNLGRVSDRKKPQVLATAARVYDEAVGKNTYSFVAKSPLNTTNVMRILLPADPQTLKITDPQGQPVAGWVKIWDVASKTCFLSFENYPDGVKVELAWE